MLNCEKNNVKSSIGVEKLETWMLNCRCKYKLQNYNIERQKYKQNSKVEFWPRWYAILKGYQLHYSIFNRISYNPSPSTTTSTTITPPPPPPSLDDQQWSVHKRHTFGSEIDFLEQNRVSDPELQFVYGYCVVDSLLFPLNIYLKMWLIIVAMPAT